MLRNEKQLLPLNINQIDTIAVLGPNANRKFGKILLGGAAAVTPPYEITPIKGLKEKCKGKMRIIKDPSKADVVFLFMGLNHDSQIKLTSEKTIEDKPEFGKESESVDRTEFGLPTAQVELIKKTIENNPNTIVILNNANPISMEEWIEDAHTIVEVWYPGMEGGRAIANILFGDVNPSGKIPLTFPKKLKDSPAHKSTKTFPGENLKVYYEEGIYVGYRYFEKKNIEPLFPFGFGLSYTSFEIKKASSDKDKLNSKEDSLKITVEVINTGERAGSEVIQIYSESPGKEVDRPLKELVGFEKVFLNKGEKKNLEIQIKAKDLAFYDTEKADWRIEQGKYILHIGNSSTSITAKIEIEYK